MFFFPNKPRKNKNSMEFNSKNLPKWPPWNLELYRTTMDSIIPLPIIYFFMLGLQPCGRI